MHLCARTRLGRRHEVVGQRRETIKQHVALSAGSVYIEKPRSNGRTRHIFLFNSDLAAHSDPIKKVIRPRRVCLIQNSRCE